ncbi:MAG: sialate O-acetylesterase [Bryobacteraceae bacterium]|nr:sialate O-acetylesterase [Bryobacteraceae bacterium]
MRDRSLFLLLAAAVAAGWQADAAVTLPRLISDHMMLQRDVPVRIWGKANPGESVTVRFQGQAVAAKAGEDGAWEVFLAPMKAGNPADMRVEAENSIVVRDVLVGEVWIASGQSNMVWPVQRSNNAEQEAASANFPQIRLFKVVLKTADQPRDDVEGEWQVCSPESVKSFSGVGYFFARHLHEKLRAPVGVIQSAWGGTPAEAWTSMEALRAEPALAFYLDNWDRVLCDYPGEKARFDRALREWEAANSSSGNPSPKPSPPRGPGHPHAPASLYNAMIAPLVPYAIRGAIWYQGESNAAITQASRYHKIFSAMIEDWRARWGQGGFPFLFVQLANYARTGNQSGWPELRESQLKTLQLRNTGMAVITDVGDPQDIHPTNKQDVGLRLALAARAIAYGERLVYSGPVYRQFAKEPGKIRLWFDHADGGLKARGGGDLKGFTIAGRDREFAPAKAQIDGATIVVSSPQVTGPEAVRYAWADDPENNLVNAEGLPASPFRTDRWFNGRMPK